MMPIQDLLNRIRWDAGFGKAAFVIGYYDRVADRMERVPFEKIVIQHGDHFGFEAAEANGSVHSVPFHRVRSVWRDGILIWHREPSTPS